MYKYFVTASITTEDGVISYCNYYYEIDYKLNVIENIEKIIWDIKEQCNSEKVTILFFTELKDD